MSAEMSSPLPVFEDHSRQEIKYTTCYMCACRCGIKVTVEDNKIRYIQGNRNHPINKGVLCAKGNAGIMKQVSPAKLQQPLKRKEGSERGSGEFEPISWDDALNLLTERLAKIRATDPNKLAYFTGRDQMQGATGLWAQQFGTVNWAAHGGFCSVNMAAAGLYTMGHAFWEFGDPDWDATKYFMLWGVAEDHSSNPIKIGLEKLKRHGGKFVAINPVRTGYQAIADEWVAIKPGTDAMLALSMIHVLLKNEQFDRDYLQRYTNAPYLVIQNPGQADDGLFWRDSEGRAQVFDKNTKLLGAADKPDNHGVLFGEFITPDGKTVKTALTLLAEKYLADDYAPENASKITGVSAETIERLALEMAHIAFKESITLDVTWTDWRGVTHDKIIGRPVSMHAMRGISAHSNGFQAARALHILQILLGTVDCPGGHRAKAPFPRHIPPANKPARPVAAGEILKGVPLGFPTAPEDLLIDENGQPLRLDKAFSWDAPLSNHGLMHMVIRNAVNKDPYAIDTMIFFMANMAWNSSMNTKNTQDMLKQKEADGSYSIPFLVVVDAFHSETVNFADLVLPDTTYLERYDTISLLDRPISEPDAICDSIRAPVLNADRDVRAWQEIMVELASRLQFPAFTNADGSRKFKDYKDFIINYQKAPGIGFLAGWRGEDGKSHLKGAPNPKQWEAYIENQSFFVYHLPEDLRYYRAANRKYLDFAFENGLTSSKAPIIPEIYSEILQKFNLAGQGLYAGPKPTQAIHKERLIQYFTPLPEFYLPLEQCLIDNEEYPFYALTQRPMMMYHSWDSQNAWLRQIVAENYLYMNRQKAESLGISDKSWVWVESYTGKIRVQVKLMEGVESNTVWTWNAIGKQSGAWGLSADANESQTGFLLNHLIAESLPKDYDGQSLTNSDPITGQAAWFDLKVKIYPAAAGEEGVWPAFETIKPLPKVNKKEADSLGYQSHKAVHLNRSIKDIFSRD